MSGLVPELRRDRNGRMVRRWVRPVSAGGAHSAIPGPTPVSEIGAGHWPMTTRRQLDFYTALRVEETWRLGSIPYVEESGVMRTAIAAATPEVIDEGLRVLVACPGDRAVRDEVKRTLRLLDEGTASPEYAARRLPFVAVEARSAQPQRLPSIPAMTGSIELVAGDQMEPEALSPEQFARALSLAHVLAAIGNGPAEERRVWLDGHGWLMLARRHPRLVRLAIENPGRGADLADFLAGRGPDADAAEQFLEQGEALAEGIL